MTRSVVRLARAAAMLISGVAVFLPGALSPAAASAAAPAADTITIKWATTAFHESGLLVIALWSSSPITSLRADLYAKGSTTPSWTVTDFGSPVAQPDGSDIYAATTPIPWGTGTGQLPLGIYSVDVTASDQGGTTITSVPEGTMRFLIEPSLTFKARPTSIDWANRTVTFSGVVTGYYPDGSMAPVQGAVVTISPTVGSGRLTATSGADGTYSTTDQILEWEWLASVTSGPASLDTTGNTEQMAILKVTADPIRITAAIAKSDVNYLASDTVSGTLMFVSGSTWLPVADAQIIVNIYRGASTIATTNSTGQYTAIVKGLTQSGSLDVTAYVSNAYFTGQTTTSVYVTVNWPAEITRVSERLSPFGVLSTSGCIVYKIPNSQNIESAAPIWVDYAASSKGPWHLLGKMNASWNGSAMCPVIGSNWTGRFAVKIPNGWYRERIGGPGIEPATSTPVHLWKYLTRITSFHVSSLTVPSGSHLTISGRLQQYTGSWHALANQVVLIVLRPKGQSTWYWIVKPQTNTYGYFKARFVDPRSATWSAVYEGGASYFASTAPLIYVSVG